MTVDWLSRLLTIVILIQFNFLTLGQVQPHHLVTRLCPPPVSIIGDQSPGSRSLQTRTRSDDTEVEVSEELVKQFVRLREYSQSCSWITDSLLEVDDHTAQGSTAQRPPSRSGDHSVSIETTETGADHNHKINTLLTLIHLKMKVFRV